MSRLLAFVGAALLAAAATAQGPVVTTVLSSGSTASRYDMVILGDGYQAQEQTRFNQDVNTFLTGLFAKAPFSGFSSYFNVHTVFRASVDSGATQPDVTPPLIRNTAYGASYNTGGTARCLYIQNTSLALADAALAPANESRILVMVNDSRYGGCASQFAVSYNGASMVEVQSHEVGHSIAGVADEYDYPNNQYTGSEPNQVNITADGVGQKWSHWWGTESVSAFEGAGYHLLGLWRPKNNCLMRNLGATLCPVCREQIVKTVNAIVDPIVDPQPTTTTVTLVRPAVQAFSFTNIVPAANNPLITWKLDGAVIAGATTPGTFLASNNLPLGTHTLTVEVLDQSTQVRNDPGNVLRETHSWTVQVVDPNAYNLRLSALSASPLQAPAGAETDLTTTVVNDGPAPASNVVVEHFLSTNTTIEPFDLYLGSSTIPTLASGQSLQVTRRVRIPAAALARPYNLIAIVDRANVVQEPNESDNVRFSAVVVQAGGCTPTLEFRDDFLYPRDAATTSIQAGGTVRPTVVARCAAPGTLYLIGWSCSGTSPGTPLAAGVTLPLNGDACTLAGLDNLNGPVFQLCFGALDGSGLANATIALPPGLFLSPSDTHLAAVLIDGSFQFVGATNAVRWTLQ